MHHGRTHGEDETIRVATKIVVLQSTTWWPKEWWLNFNKTKKLLTLQYLVFMWEIVCFSSYLHTIWGILGQIQITFKQKKVFIWRDATELLVTGKFTLKLQTKSILWSSFTIVSGKWELRFHGHKLSSRFNGEENSRVFLLQKYLLFAQSFPFCAPIAGLGGGGCRVSPLWAS